MAWDKALLREVRLRADHRCEYCLLSEDVSELSFPIDHIIARQHNGPTTLENLALCCGNCNLHKGPNISGIDPDTMALTRLFNPRLDQWNDHFEYRGPIIFGRTAIGRTTIQVLAMNALANVRARSALIEDGKFQAG